MLYSKRILSFLKQLEFNQPLPEGIAVMNPYHDKTTWKVCTDFYRKYYQDIQPRNMILGINPGRFGGGITGIPFTDPIRLQEVCGIANPFAKKPELSSVFVYELIERFGGPEPFYQNFYVSSTSPLGFIRHNLNCNYYDDPNLQKDIRGFVVDCLQRQIGFGIRTDQVFVLGQGKNFQFLQTLNKEIQFCQSLVGLPHPRFVMQYQLKRKSHHLSVYLRALGRG